jgi:multisite-specific tRNA:(cytosine-C5)-methyltransferase
MGKRKGGYRGKNNNKTPKKREGDYTNNDNNNNNNNNNNDGEERKKGSSSGNWSRITQDNESFKEYYKNNNVVEAEQFDEFIKTLLRPLPTTIRVNTLSNMSLHVQSTLLSYKDNHVMASNTLLITPSNNPTNNNNTNINTNDSTNNTNNSENSNTTINTDNLSNNINNNNKDNKEGEVEAVQAIEWSGYSYRVETSRSQLRSDKRLQELHKFITLHNDVGSITRQEAVSMIPVLFLHVQPGMRCIDLCAAPGSKTGQIIEALGLDASDKHGLVVANDVDEKRCYMLVHQTGRLASHKCLITNHEAQHFPIGPFLYDRVLTDVPCMLYLCFLFTYTDNEHRYW